MVSPPQISLTTWRHEPPEGFGQWIIHDGKGEPEWLNSEENTAIYTP